MKFPKYENLKLLQNFHVPKFPSDKTSKLQKSQVLKFHGAQRPFLVLASQDWIMKNSGNCCYGIV